MHAQISIPFRDVSQGAAAIIYAQLRRDAQRRLNGQKPLLSLHARQQLERGLVDHRRPPKIVFAGDATLDLPEVTASALAHWLNPAVPPAPLEVGAQPSSVALDLIAHLHRRATDHDGDEAGHVIAAALAAGLELRIGRHLSDSELAVYHTLITLAPRDRSTNQRVCEDCGIVFTAPRARSCPTCRRNPARASVDTSGRAVIRGDRRRPTVHFGVADNSILGYGWIRRPGTPQRTAYSRICLECESSFISTDARTRYCPQHAGSTGRARRTRSYARAKRSPETPEIP